MSDESVSSMSEPKGSGPVDHIKYSSLLQGSHFGGFEQRVTRQLEQNPLAAVWGSGLRKNRSQQRSLGANSKVTRAKAAVVVVVEG